MFGINNVSDIVKGHYNEITNKENELYETRIEICKQCPLCTNSSIGYICNSSKCINIKTGELVYAPGKDIACGCGCRLSAKTRLPNAKCVLNKW